MTSRAIMAEIPGHVIRVCRIVEIRLVALIAIRVHELVIAIDVTRLTLHCDVCPCQWEAGCAVIERRPIPVCR
jgi:hypothetical protein